MPRLLSVNVGLPRDIAWRGETVRTAIWKEPVQGRRMVRRLNIDGDGQGDLAGHGGEQRAVFVYQMDSYHYWERQLGRNDFVFGQFGENFTIDGLSDEEVCIGDQYRIGSALFEVTQPRVTCYRVGIRMNDPQMPALLVAHKKPGFYFRVLQEGEVEAGDEIVKVADGQETWMGVLEGLNRFKGHSSLKTWMFRILTNCAKTRARREGRSIPFSSLPEVDADLFEPAVDPERFWLSDHQWPGHWVSFPSNWNSVPEECLLSQEIRTRLGQAIAALPTNQREVIVLRDIEGWTSEEICHFLGISEVNQRVLLHRARSKVRGALEKYFEEE